MKKNQIIMILIITFVLTTSMFAAGEVDTSFGASAASRKSANVSVMKLQPDGKVLIAGFFTTINGKATFGITRLNTDGTPDTSFNPPDFVTAGWGQGGIITAIGLQSDGKIIVGGLITATSSNSGEYLLGLRRLNPNGTLDTSFFIQPFAINFGGSVNDIEVLSNDKIIVVGTFKFTGFEETRYGIYRLNANGAIDESFTQPFYGADITNVEIQNDGKILATNLISNGDNIRRFNGDGTTDNSFGTITTNKRINKLKILSDNSILVGGDFTIVNGFNQGGVTKVNPDGSLNLSFNLNNTGLSLNGFIYGIWERSNGKILLTGGFQGFNGISRTNLVQLNSDGNVDTSFNYVNSFSTESFREVITTTNDKVLVGTYSQIAAPSLMRLNSDGALDTTFTTLINRIGLVRKIAQQSDGKIVFGGEFDFANNTQRNSLARVNIDGSLDNSFVPFFNTSTVEAINAIAIQSDGKILVGFNNGLKLVRLNSDGSKDTTFNPVFAGNWLVYDIYVLTDGKILVAGSLMGDVGLRYITRLNSNGSTDTTFIPTNPNNLVYKISVQPDGKILIGGNFTQIGTSIRGRIGRLNANGSLDTTFNPPGGANNTVYNICESIVEI